jgi:septation ring formation regulator EzrA
VGGGPPGEDDAQCCIRIKTDVDLLNERLIKFRTTMKEDVELLFSRVNDRLDYIQRRINWVEGGHEDLTDELQEVKEESV